MPTPRFSVVIPTYNRAEILPTAMRSVLAQSDGDFELIVVDDGSTDDTAGVVAGMVAAVGDARITYLPQANSGVSAARNAGAAIARGDLLVFLDSDDELLADALARFRSAADEHGWTMLLSAWISVSPDRRNWRTLLPSTGSFTPGGTPHGRTPWLPGAFAISRTLFAEIGGYDAQLRFAENTELAWRARPRSGERDEQIGTIAEPLVIRYATDERRYDTARYDAATRMLDRYADDLALEPKRRGMYRAIGGVAAARLGRRKEALALSLAAVRDDPRSGARYRNLLSVARAAVSRTKARSDGSAAPTATPATPPGSGTRPSRAGAPGAIHGVIVTFGRPASLAKMVDQLAGVGLDSLTVIDNAPSPESKAAAHAAESRLAPRYVPMDENTGPAGGIAAGMAEVLTTAADDDWILLLDDDRLTGSDGSVQQLRDYATWLLDHGAPVGAVGLVGARFDRRSGRLHRPKNEELAGPVTVDFVAGNQLPMIRVAAVRAVGLFDASLFFGFDDLDFGLRLGRHGLGVYTYGPISLEARRRFSRLDPSVGTAPRRESPWRRYYGVRNHIVIMRRYASWSSALVVTLEHLFGRPLRDLRRRRRDWPALTSADLRGCVDAWSGRAGRRVEPAPDAAVQT